MCNSIEKRPLHHFGAMKPLPFTFGQAAGSIQIWHVECLPFGLTQTGGVYDNYDVRYGTLGESAWRSGKARGW